MEGTEVGGGMAVIWIRTQELRPHDIVNCVCGGIDIKRNNVVVVLTLSECKVEGVQLV